MFAKMNLSLVCLVPSNYFIYFLFLTKRKESKEGAKNVPSKKKPPRPIPNYS